MSSTLILLYLKNLRLNAWIELLISVIYVGVWVAFALWLPWDKKYNYDWTNSNLDRFRFSLFIIGICFTIYLIVAEMFEVYSDFKFQKVLIINKLMS